MARIKIKHADPEKVAAVASAFELPGFIAQVLVSRGHDTPEKVEHFLTPSLARDWHDPYEIDGMEEAVTALQQAVQGGRRILVFGDFDLDGISATTIMTRALRAFGADAVPFIPLRFEEGYGLTPAAIERVLTYKPGLVVTVDNGIAAKEEVAHLRSLGIDVVITDHHEPADQVPVEVPVVDPKQQGIPSQILAGAGVALKTVQALGARMGKPNLWLDLIDFATLGTVADLMPMVGENRALVSEGIRLMNESPRVCIAVLMAQAGQADKQLSSTNLSFTLVPRLNAAGRMGNAQLALDLLMSDDLAEAAQLAAQLEETNTQRRVIESELADVAFEQSESTYHGQRALIVAGEDWHEGVKGIVASRLTNKYGVPSILFTVAEGEARGSGRSVGDVNLFKAVESCKDMLTRFGGHGAAVGVTLPADRLPEFEQRLCTYMDSLDIESFQPRINVDAVVDLSEMTLENVSKLDLLAPFGQENLVPSFMARNVLLEGARAVGADKTHLSCKITDGVNTLSCIKFRCDGIDSLIACQSLVDAVFELQIDTWRGNRTVKAIVSEIIPAMECAALNACADKEASDLIDRLLENEGAAPQVPCDEAGGGARAADRAVWSELACGDRGLLRTALAASFLGEGSLHPSQREALEALDAGKSVLCVMGTGRGKSLIFQIHAAELALSGKGPTLLVYPLRALIYDQAASMRKVLEPFGLSVEVLCGDTSQSDRKRIFDALGSGQTDLVLTTPEFASFHAEQLAKARFTFMVVDEAHHLATSSESFRPLYKRLGDLRWELGNPKVLALTATLGPGAQEKVKEGLGIDVVVSDDAERANLAICDVRNVRQRDAYLANLAAKGEKTIVYVNSRMETILLTRMLRSKVPQLALMFGFYNAGLNASERAKIEDLFRTGSLQVLVATSAFGEGVNIPDVRNVVLYNMPFSEIEFNQMSGRAGRDGDPASIHLLYSGKDARVNKAMLGEATPDHDTMAQIYRTLRQIQRSNEGAAYERSASDIADEASRHTPFKVDEQAVVCALRVFKELGLVEADRLGGHAGPAVFRVHVVDYQGKVELSQSVRYQEGLDELAAFDAFAPWAMKAPVPDLEARIRRPLMP